MAQDVDDTGEFELHGSEVVGLKTGDVDSTRTLTVSATDGDATEVPTIALAGGVGTLSGTGLTANASDAAACSVVGGDRRE